MPANGFERLAQNATLYGLASGSHSGVYNMALDEALLEWVRACPTPVLIVRTYLWQEPTLSLGVHQAVRDLNFLLAFYQRPQGEAIQALVRRPTGGRAILHGEDISYAFITNDTEVLKQRLKASYQIFTGVVQQTLARLSLPVVFSGNAAERDYVRSPICFETHTPSDLLATDGEKLTGSAQLRRAGGLLQHGAAFLKPYGVSDAAFTQALWATIEQAGGKTPTPFPWTEIAPLFDALEARYCSDSSAIWASASTTSGSHLEPASV